MLHKLQKQNKFLNMPRYVQELLNLKKKENVNVIYLFIFCHF